MVKEKIYLASQSPRRFKLLSQLGYDVHIVKADVEECRRAGEPPHRLVQRLSLEKMHAAEKKHIEGIIITADTIVVFKGLVLGKPADGADAVRMLTMLSGNTHTVYTGYAVLNTTDGTLINEYAKTKVTFRKLEAEEIDRYVAGGSPLDKAGSYGIQDEYGAVFVEKVNGCYYNVVGLPLSRVFSAIQKVSKHAAGR